MPLIEWTTDLSVGVQAIDQQHRQWIAIINRLHDCLISESQRPDVKALIGEMESYASHHFAAEERLMAECRFPGLEQHRQMHRSFIAQIQDLKSQLASGEYVFATSLMKILKAWLEDHIKTQDKLYAPFVLHTDDTSQ